MIGLARAAGESDALSAFGLAHGTPRPPPSWAHDWLSDKRKITIPSMLEKKAFIGGGLGELALLHTGANVVGKGLRRFFPNIGKSNFASGLTHGFQGKLHPATEAVMRYGLGPESLVNYEMGKRLAGQLGHLSPIEQRAALKSMASNVGESAHISKTPLGGSSVGGIERYLKGEQGWMNNKRWGLSSVSADPNVKPSLGQRAIAPALGALSVAAAPHTALQFGWNAVRDRLGHSDIGKKLMVRGLAKGARGQKMNPLLEHASDIVLSPAFSDPQRMGLALNKEYGGLKDEVNAFTKRKNLPSVPLPEAGHLVDFAENVHQRMPQAPAAAAPAAPQASGGTQGMMTKALLGGGALLAARNALQPDEERR